MSVRALIASGEETLVRRLTSALGDIGVRVESVPQTGRALAMLASQRYEAVLLDCDLEGGMDLVELIRLDPQNQRALVLACVSGSDAARDASRLGANFVLSKPINWEMAKRTLRAARTMIIRERRKNIRQKVQITATLRTAERTVDVSLVDISQTGVALRTAADMKVGKQVALEFRLPGTRLDLQCTGNIVWVRDGQVGLQFLTLSPSAAETIVGWLSRHSPRSNGAAS